MYYRVVYSTIGDASQDAKKGMEEFHEFDYFDDKEVSSATEAVIQQKSQTNEYSQIGNLVLDEDPLNIRVVLDDRTLIFRKNILRGLLERGISWETITQRYAFKYSI